MSEETQPTPEQPTETTTEEAAPQDAAPEAAAEEAPQAPAYDWRRALDEAPADEIRRHPKFAGIVGSEQQLWRQSWLDSQKAEADAAARQKAEDDLREMAQRNPVAFADQWLGQEEAKQQQARITGLETNARQEIGKRIGAAFHAIPEWGDIAGDAESLAKLATALQGKSNDDVLTAWNTTAVELVADRRARAIAEKLVAERLTAERAAWETEASANGFVTSSRPDLVRGGHTATADPEPDFRREPKAWDAWWHRNK